MATDTHTQSEAPIVAHHFNNIRQQHDSMRFGMWLFLVTEVMFFGGVFCAYALYRWWYPHEFEAGSTALNPLIAGINSFLLLSSSLTATLAIRAAYVGNQSKIQMYLGLTILLGVAFLGFKAYEYYSDIKEGLIPSPRMLVHAESPDHHSRAKSEFGEHLEEVLHHKEYYKRDGNLEKVNLDRVRIFFIFYYAMTGLHVIHMVVGIGLFGMQFVLAKMGYFKPKERYVYIEVLALYWHFVELVWIFLLPLLYMAGHHSFKDLGF